MPKPKDQRGRPRSKHGRLSFSLPFFRRKASAQPSPLTVEQCLGIKRREGIALSPDRRWVAFTETTRDLAADEARDQIRMVSVESGELVTMTASTSNACAAKWSPDGRYLAVLSDRDEETYQVWLLDRRGGDPRQLTEFTEGVESYDWSPDATQLAVITKGNRSDEASANQAPHVLRRLPVKDDYAGYRDSRGDQLYVVDVATGKADRRSQDAVDYSCPRWAPDGKSVAVLADDPAIVDPRAPVTIKVFPAESKPTPGIALTREGESSDLSWSDDGTRIAHTITNEKAKVRAYALPQLCVTDLSGKQPLICEALRDRCVHSPRWSPDGRAIYGIVATRCEQRLFKLDLDREEVSWLVQGKDVVIEFDVGSDDTLVALVSRPHEPEQLFCVTGNGQLSPLMQPASENTSSANLGRVFKESFASADGTSIDMLVVRPHRELRRSPAPCVLLLHGGPQSQWDYRFEPEAQLFAAAGYLVLMPNPRGSWGYGQVFADAIYRDWGGIDFEDVMAAVDHAIAKGWADPERLGICGWSYGGMLTNHVITKTKRFRAAITGASATLYMANYGHDQHHRWWEEELGLPWKPENIAHWNRLSPFFAIDKVTTPTLIVSGEEDWNVPVLNSEQLFTALKRRGVPTELVVYPGEGHTLSVPSYEKDLLERYLDWFAKHIAS